jgi:hypothetical protein
MNRAWADRLTSVVLILLIALYLWQASRYNANARLIPTIVGVSALGVAVLTLVVPLLRQMFGRAALAVEADPDDPGAEGTASYRARLALIVGWTILLAVAAIAAGFVVTVPIFTLALFWFAERRLSLTAILLTLALTAIAWVFTVHLLAHGWLDAPLWRWLWRQF